MDTLKKISEITDYLNTQIVGRRTEITAIMRAFVAGIHAIAISETGLAKTALADRLFASVRGAEKFSIQIQQGVPLEEMMGPLDPKQLRETGTLTRNVDGYLPTAHFLFADELFDGSPAMLRSLLGVLNEREYRLGRQRVKCPLRFAFAATNYVPEDERLRAVIDRFGVRIRMQAIHRTDANGSKTLELVQAFRDHHRSALRGVPKITLEEYDDLQGRIRGATIPDDVLQLYAELVSRLAAKNRVIQFSDRRVCLALNMASTSAVLGGRSEVEPRDLSDTRYVLCEVNNTAHIGAFDEVFSTIIGSANVNKTAENPGEDFLAIPDPTTVPQAHEILTALDKIITRLLSGKPRIKYTEEDIDRLADRTLEISASFVTSPDIYAFIDSAKSSAQTVTFLDGKSYALLDAARSCGDRLQTLSNSAVKS